ncbi:MAG TPA: DUF4181 domain-containing protein [Niallia sp.]|nr:DUF4181 domain-containing protein [Niallia sp.]
MTITTRIIGIIIILLIYLLLSELYLKRTLNIKEVKKSILTKGRKRVFVTLEILLIILFVVSTYYVVANNLVFFPIMLFLASVHFFRGIEEWREEKSEKRYYHDWLASLMFLVMFLFMMIGEL